MNISAIQLPRAQGLAIRIPFVVLFGTYAAREGRAAVRLLAFLPQNSGLAGEGAL